MDKLTIKGKAHKIETIKDLLILLNEVKADELGNKAYPFSIRQLSYYCNPNKDVFRYKTFKIPKKKPGEFRTISAPSRGLKSILTFLNIILQSLYEPSPYAMGFIPGRSVVDNARLHLNQNYVFNVDLKDFFTSIDQARVWKRLQLPPFSFNKEVASVIAGLCCKKEVDPFDGTKIRYVLPQGAPTSPIITNMICDTLDRRLHGLARRFGLNYSRYADDITFSSMHSVYAKDSEFRKELHRIIADQNFKINPQKTRLEKKGSRQEVTGLIVSNRLNVSKKYVRSLRNILYIWEHYGSIVAYFSFIPHYFKDHNGRVKGNFHLESVIDGKLQYLKMVKGSDDPVYLRLKLKFDILRGAFEFSNPFSGSRLKFLETLNLSDFEKRLNTVIKNGVNKQGEEYTYFEINGKQVRVFVSDSVKSDVLYKTEISLCENEKGKRFYLLHKPMLDNMLESIIDENGKELKAEDILSVWESRGIDEAIQLLSSPQNKSVINIWDFLHNS